MDLQKIRNMSDVELSKYLKSLTIKNNTECIKCGEKNSNYTINIQNKKPLQQKKLCSICEKCYFDLLVYLGTLVINWD